MERSSAWVGLACCIAGVALAFAAPPAAIDIERPEGVHLPRLAAVGDYPPADERIVVHLDSRGHLTIDGRETLFTDLPSVLRPFASRRREPDGSSALYVVLRVDRDVPWRACVWMMQTCADPQAKLYRIGFAAMPEDGSEEGALFFFLPKDT